MKTFPQNHYNSITIPSSHYLRHDCICCSANPPPNRPSGAPPPAPSPICYGCNQARWRESAVSAFPVGCVERRLAAARFTPVLHTQSASIHHPPWRGNSRLTCSYGTAICRGEKDELLKRKQEKRAVPVGSLACAHTLIRGAKTNDA